MSNFRPITLTQLNWFITINALSFRGGLEVTQQTAVRQVPGWIPGFDKDFYVCHCVLLMRNYFFSLKTILCHDFCKL